MSMNLLSLCSFLAPENIPRSLFIDGSEHLPELLASAAKDYLEFDEVIAALRGYSLINADAKGISVHRLVQLLTRERMKPEERKMWAEISVNLVEEAFPENSDKDVSAWRECAVLLPHALSSIGYAEELGSIITGRLRNKAGQYLYGRGEYQRAKILYERALQIDEEVQGPDHPDVARDLNSLSEVLRRLDDLQEARKCVQRALKIDEQVSGLDHAKVASDLDRLGSVLQDQGELQEARKCFERAIKIYEKVYGPDHTLVAMAMNNLGTVLGKMGDRLGAKMQIKRALKIFEKALGPNHPKTKKTKKNLRSLG